MRLIHDEKAMHGGAIRAKMLGTLATFVDGLARGGRAEPRGRNAHLVPWRLGLCRAGHRERRAARSVGRPHQVLGQPAARKRCVCCDDRALPAGHASCAIEIAIRQVSSHGRIRSGWLSGRKSRHARSEHSRSTRRNGFWRQLWPTASRRFGHPVDLRPADRRSVGAEIIRY